MSVKRFAVSLTWGLLGLTVVLLWLASGQPAAAQPTGWTVCPAGPPTCDYAIIQDAVDAANDEDVIKVATGVYTDVHVRIRQDMTTTGVVTQVVYISKTVDIRGGYTTANWMDSNPISNPTTLDAQGQGRVLYITGAISPTVEGLRITGGDAKGLGGEISPWILDRDAGGGVYVITATVVLTNNQIVSNTSVGCSGLNLVSSPSTFYANYIAFNDASFGGGLCLRHSSAELYGNTFDSNRASPDGCGGLLLEDSPAILSDNNIARNMSGLEGGGACLYRSDAVLSRNVITRNRATEWGGGLFLRSSKARLTENTVSKNRGTIWGGGIYIADASAVVSNCMISHNYARHGGGVSLDHSASALSGNIIVDNGADHYGGGLYLVYSDALLDRNTVNLNYAGWSGGGLYVWLSDATLTGNTVMTNSGDSSSGLSIDQSDATLTENIIADNTTGSSGRCGGATLRGGASTLNKNTIRHNWASRDAGGLCITGGAAKLNQNMIFSNIGGSGGGVRLSSANNTVLNNNVITDNMAQLGGGISLLSSRATLSENTIFSNTASSNGGGVYLEGSTSTISENNITANKAHRGGGVYFSEDKSTLVNSFVTDNRGNDLGSGLYIKGSSPILVHTTVAHNTDTSAQSIGIYITGTWKVGMYGPYYVPSNVVMTNTVLVSHTVGITVAAASEAVLEATLWASGSWANKVDWAGAGSIVTGSVNIWGEPVFVDPDAGDYHIGPGSAAADMGVNAGVDVDIDGEPRPMGTGYDIGADELSGPDLTVVKRASADAVQPGDQVTYTIRVTNTGTPTLIATITDFLPSNADPTGTLTWQRTLTDPGDVWTQTVVVTVDVGYTGLLTNVVQVAAEEGATGIYTNVVSVEEAVTGLTATNDGPTEFGGTTKLTATVTAGSNVSYIWAFGDGDSGTGAVVMHTYPKAQVYTAIVTACNSVSEVVATTRVTITNEPPVTDAGSNQIVHVSSTVTLDGSASHDPDGHLPLTYHWSQAGGPAIVLSNGSVAKPTFTAPGSPTVLTFTLSVTDAHGLAALASDMVVISVTDQPISGLSVASSDSSTELGQPTAFTATVESGSNVTYTWDFGDAAAPLTVERATSTGASVSHTYAAAGQYTAVVTANNSVSLLTATTTVTVSDLNFYVYLPLVFKNR